MASANFQIDVLNVPEMAAVIEAARKVVYVSGIHLDELRTALEALEPAGPPNGEAPKGTP